MPYERPKLPPSEALREATARLKKTNDARAAKLAAGPVIVTSSRISEEQENARCEIIALCDMGARELEKCDHGDDYVRVAEFYKGFGDAVREFCIALGARTTERRADALQTMRDAIASLDRYRGER